MSLPSPTVTIVGGGLAGCEAAFQLAERGISVALLEMKPQKRTPAQTGDSFAELVCSNSLRGAALANAVGLLKEELRRAGSLIMRAADHTAVPAGGALAVDRERFSEFITRAIHTHPRISVCTQEVTSIPDARPLIIATGPLTTDALASHLAEVIGQKHLAYYDAIAPIVAADSLRWDRVWKQSRYGKGGAVKNALAMDARAAEALPDDYREDQDPGDEAYVNCPFNEHEYRAFVEALSGSEKVEAREFEEARYFEGCLPCEVMAERGLDTLRYGPMKPIGLVDPRTGRRPYAVIQLRAEDAAATAYNLVGFQTRMKYPEQLRVFRMIPGLEEAEFLRLGSVHRNTFVNAPEVLSERFELRALPGVHLAGQITGVEGYVESAAGGFLCALTLAFALRGHTFAPPPPSTALGGLAHHLAKPVENYQPSNITWAHVAPLADVQRKVKKRDRYERLGARGLADFVSWWAQIQSIEHPDQSRT
ncbi:MAG: methylenetetrahydrofolate--tRNA-(uracil(54)-C(5))-methyltransferase (FADH(2)-oxidizing) TrmFO [Polyangiaceae bacterium]|nr:methylenetetrahydrofolate--tRNA-(uracil(54)-C(5))-methyltransferase (FADH(2)-oxidizing) TrmFO [Polyangiaceae bacterium]